MPTLVRRTTLKVRDMERAKAFYQDVLGLRVYYDNEITLTGKLLPAGAAGDVTRLVIMQAADPVIGMIGLLQWINPQLDAPPVSYSFDFGNPVFVLAVDDAAQIYAAAQKFGCEIRAPLSEGSYPGADGSIVRVRSVGVFDPDGHFFECNERLSS
jgi:catechol 2,3-dioxygenase-like lactoylglutathione lyase family enzyme